MQHYLIVSFVLLNVVICVVCRGNDYRVCRTHFITQYNDILEENISKIEPYQMIFCIESF